MSEMKTGWKKRTILFLRNPIPAILLPQYKFIQFLRRKELEPHVQVNALAIWTCAITCSVIWYKQLHHGLYMKTGLLQILLFAADSTPTVVVSWWRWKEHDHISFHISIIELQFLTIKDAFFANAEKMESQPGYPFQMVDESRALSVIDFGSNKWQLIARSVMAAEVPALVLGLYYAFHVKDRVNELLGRPLEFDSMIDSRSVLNVIAKDGETTQRLLQIFVLALRQSYDEKDILRISWVPGKHNPVDS